MTTTEQWFVLGSCKHWHSIIIPLGHVEFAVKQTVSYNLALGICVPVQIICSVCIQIDIAAIRPIFRFLLEAKKLT